jgi:hypothetical protein
MSSIYVQIFGHAAAVLTFTALAYYAWQYRTALRRNVQRSRFLYRLMLASGSGLALLNLISLYRLVGGVFPSLPGDWLDLSTEYLSILAQSVIIFYFLANKIIVERASRPKRVLAIGAHVDDFETGAGATLARLHASGAQISGLVLTQEPGEGSKRSWSASDFSGIDDFQQLNFEAGCLKDNPEAASQEIAKVIQRIQPELIFTHSAHDQNADHRTAHMATLKAGGDVRTILCYESAASSEDFCPAMYVDGREYLAVKTETLRRFQENGRKPYLHPEHIRGQMAYRGTQAGSDYAEGFEVQKMVSPAALEI